MIWLLLVVLLALLVWWLLEGGVQTRASPGEVATVVLDDAAYPAAAATAATADPVSDLTQLTGASDPGMLAGRQVVLAGVPVQGLAGDGGFWLGTEEGERVFAVWSGGEAIGGEGELALEPGQVVEVHGVLRRMPADLDEQLLSWNVGGADAAAVSAQPVYLDVDSVFVLGGG